MGPCEILFNDLHFCDTMILDVSPSFEPTLHSFSASLCQNTHDKLILTLVEIIPSHDYLTFEISGLEHTHTKNVPRMVNPRVARALRHSNVQLKCEIDHLEGESAAIRAERDQLLSTLIMHSASDSSTSCKGLIYITEKWRSNNFLLL